MRKGFDRWLANALQTTQRTLFIDYANVAPENAAVISHVLHHPQVPVIVSDVQGFADDPLFGEVIARLEPTERDDVCQYAIRLVLSRHDARSAEFRRYERQLNAEEDMREDGKPIDPATIYRSSEPRRPRRTKPKTLAKPG